MTTFYMMVGLVGSGKSTFAETLASSVNARVISSDKKREEEYGREDIQGDNSLLFELIHKEIIESLKNGEDIIFDATNINRKHRMALLNNIPKGVIRACYLIATEYPVCIAQNNSRLRKVPEAYIKRQRESFNVPLYKEGFDVIEIVFNYNAQRYDIQDFIERVKSFDQKTPYHSMTLGEHSLAVAKEMKTQYSLNSMFWYCVGLLHDCGKEYTGVFKNTKGEPSEIQHFYNHENVGAYESLFYFDAFGYTSYDVIIASSLIEFHMRMYGAKTDKAIKKIVNLLGDTAFGWLNALHQADKKSH